MLMRLLHALGVGFIVGLACLLLSVVLPHMKVEVIVAIGAFLGQWAWPIGLAAAILDFARGGNWSFGGPKP